MRMTASRGRRRFSALVATDTDLYRSGVCFQSLSAGECCDRGCEPRQSLRADLLYRDHLDVIGSREPAPQARGSGGGQNVIWAAGVVARGLGTGGADKYAACVANSREQGSVGDAEMLRR